MHADSLLPSPNMIYASLVDTVSRQITFTWSSVTPECTTIQYNILTSNCGSCPTTTNHTTVTCTDVPTAADNATTCTFAIQAMNCEIIMGKFSKPITVLLRGNSLMMTSNNVLSTHNPGDNNNNQDHGYATALSLACIFAVGLMMSIVALVTVIAISYRRKRVVKEETATLELVTPATTRLEMPDSDNYENVIQSSQEHIQTTNNVAYDRVVK